MEDKDIDKMIDEIVPVAKKVFTVTPDNPRAMKAERLAELLKEKNIESFACENVKEAVDKVIFTAKEDGESGVAVAIGSLYMVGDIISYVKLLTTTNN